MSKKFRIIANWKMNKTIPEALAFFEQLPKLSNPIYIAPAFTALFACAQKKRSDVILGAQNIYSEISGAYTGEVSANMVKDAGARFVILGHSERRQILGENNSFINKKIKQALLQDLEIILCVGETLSERNAQQTVEVLKKQLTESLFEISSNQLSKIMIAYEPIWAIGTGNAATAQMIQSIHFNLRTYISQQWSQEAAEKISILYGGSINADNILDLIEEPDIDGALIGGAALEINSFTKIIQHAGKLTP